MPTGSKSFTEVKFFLKNTATTTAFTTTFKGGATPYPLEDFSDLDATIGDYEIVSPTKLSTTKALFGTSASATNKVDVVGGSTNIFGSVLAGDYLLFDNGTDGEANLQLLGVVKTTGTTSVTLENVPTALADSGVDGKTIYRFPKTVAGNAFVPGDNFYLVVKNPDFSTGSGLHDSVLNIDTTASSASSTVFAYSVNRTVNPTYFKTIQISQNAVVDAGLTTAEIGDQENVPSKITAISTYAQGSTTIGPTNTSQIPYWSVYEINPYADTSSVFNKQTFYKVQIEESLPAKQITLVTGGE
jgi:hypothetical protein